MLPFELPEVEVPTEVKDVIEDIVDGARDIVDTVGEAAEGFEITKGGAAAKTFLDAEFGAVISNFKYTGSEDAVFNVSNFTIANSDINWDGGILLSSGRMPGIVNLTSSYSKSHGEPGDADLDAVVKSAFDGAGETKDAAVIQFDFNVSDPEIKGIRFDLVFGSDEFSEYSDTSFVDVAAIWLDDNLDGKFEVSENKALFGGDAKTPLSVISQNKDNFVDNEKGSFPIEWDGFGALSARPMIRQGENSIKIGIADTGDQILDSGLFITNFQFLKEGTTRDEILKVVTGTVGKNDLTTSDLREEIQLADGVGSVSGTLSNFDGDIVRGFTDQTKIVLDAKQASLVSTEVLSGATIVKIDGDGDGSADSTVTFEGDFKDAKFSTKPDGEKSEITVELPQKTTENETAFDKRATTPTTGTAPTDLNPIRDFDGNDLGAGNDWKLVGAADVQFDGDAEFIYVNATLSRWATVGPDATGVVDFNNHGTGGDTRVVGIYIDPEVELGNAERFGPNDSQQRFQNDLRIDNLTVIDAFDFDGDGFQEIYFKVNDGTAYLRALMHADGNIQYANYQSSEQVQDYLSGLGYGQDVLDIILV